MRLPTRQDGVENSDKVYCFGLNERGRIHRKIFKGEIT